MGSFCLAANAETVQTQFAPLTPPLAAHGPAVRTVCDPLAALVRSFMYLNRTEPFPHSRKPLIGNGNAGQLGSGLDTPFEAAARARAGRNYWRLEK